MHYSLNIMDGIEDTRELLDMVVGLIDSLDVEEDPWEEVDEDKLDVEEHIQMILYPFFTPMVLN